MEEKPFSDITYEQYLKEERLMGSRCKECDARYVPPRSLCVKCFRSDMDWMEMKGIGRLAAFTRINPSALLQFHNAGDIWIVSIVPLRNHEGRGNGDTRKSGQTSDTFHLHPVHI